MLRITISVLHDDGDKSGAGGIDIDEGGRRDDSSVMMVQLYSTVQYSTVLCQSANSDRKIAIIRHLNKLQALLL